MAIPLSVAIDLAEESSGLSLQQLSYVGHAYLTATPENLDQTISYIAANFHLFTASVNVAALKDTADITALLNAGAGRVFATYEQLQALKATTDDSRLVLLLETGRQNKEKIIDAIADTSVGVFAHDIIDLDFICGWLQEYGTSERPPVFVTFAVAPTLEDVVRIGQLNATPILPSKLLTVDPEAQPELLSVAAIFMAGVTSDRTDKLIATVVVDEQGVALGLVYSSPESVKESLRTGTGVYQSRKRGLWYKGATSGSVQELVRIEADCDQDCLQFVVRQKGTG